MRCIDYDNHYQLRPHSILIIIINCDQKRNENHYQLNVGGEIDNDYNIHYQYASYGYIIRYDMLFLYRIISDTYSVVCVFQIDIYDDILCTMLYN